MVNTQQLQVWKSQFGKDYTDRNLIDPVQIKPLFKEMLGGLKLETVLEVGCNRGHNLIAIADIFKIEPIGIEPNDYARLQARQKDKRISIINSDIFNIPFKDNFFDLSFTSCVLIHVSLKDLPKAIRELYRVSRRYILCAEFYNEEEKEINYWGHNNLLWKRDFKKHFLDIYPKMKILRSGFYGEEVNCRTDWWLFEKHS